MIFEVLLDAKKYEYQANAQFDVCFTVLTNFVRDHRS